MRRASVLQIRVSEEEMGRIKEKAGALGLGVSEYVRGELLRNSSVPAVRLAPKNFENLVAYGTTHPEPGIEVCSNCWHPMTKHHGFGAACQEDGCRCGGIPASYKPGRMVEIPPPPDAIEIPASMVEKLKELKELMPGLVTAGKMFEKSAMDSIVEQVSAHRFTEPPPMPLSPEGMKLLEKVQAEAKAVRGKQCVHGKPKGYNCWQCGGLAKVDG